MGKGIIKHGFKSGILPVARDIFKTPIKPVKPDPSVVQGYAPNIKHPKGSTRDPVVPTPVSVEDRIKATAYPLKQYAPETLAKMPEAQRYKKLRSELRKKYLVETLRKEEQKINKEEEQRIKKRHEEKLEAKRLREANFETEVTKLTLPTIEQYLEGPIMRHRTPEENQALALRKKSNRLTTELKVKEEKAVRLLDLYYECDNFIVTEAELNEAIEKAFQDSSHYNEAVHNVKSKLENYQEFEGAYMEQINDQFHKVIFGSAGAAKPGLYEIEDQMSGKFSRLAFEADSKAQENASVKHQQVLDLLQDKKS